MSLYEPACGDRKSHRCHLFWPDDEGGRVSYRCLGVSPGRAGVFVLFDHVERLRQRCSTGVLIGMELEVGPLVLSAIRRTLTPSFDELIAPPGDVIAHELPFPYRERKDMAPHTWRIVAASGEIETT